MAGFKYISTFAQNLRTPSRIMSRKIFFLFFNLLTCCILCAAPQKSNLQERAEAAIAKNQNDQARSLYHRAYEEYVRKGQIQQAVECGTQTAALLYKANNYKEAFDFLHEVDKSISEAHTDNANAAGLHYYVTKERMQMYIRLRKKANAQDHLNAMERQASMSNDESVKNDLLYTKAIFYYTFGQNEKGNAVFKQMIGKLTATKDYDKVDEVYKTLIANGRKAGSASLVAQAYSGYIAWKDSVSALKHAAEINTLKQQIADGEASIAEKDSDLTSLAHVITGLCILSAVLAIVLVVGVLLLLFFLRLTRRQKKDIRRLNENNALKAKFITNVAAELMPTLQKLDAREPAVRALLDFTDHIQTLSQLETNDEKVQFEEVSLPTFCEGLTSQVRDKLKPGTTLTADVPHMSAMINKEYISHILLHLLNNAAQYTPEGGFILFEVKKRGAHKLQFLVSNTGSFIPEEKREDVFKAFLEVRDLTTGDGLGLPICKQMAIKMGGDLTIDPTFTKGTRFVLNLQAS